MPPSIGQFFLVKESAMSRSGGKTSEIINYHIEGRRIVVERLFDRAELRFGIKRQAQRVRLIRQAASVEPGTTRGGAHSTPALADMTCNSHSQLLLSLSSRRS